MPSLHRAGAREPVSRRPSRRRDLRLLLVVMVLGASAMATMAYVAYLLWPRWPESAIAANAPALPITVGGVTFNLPPAAIRVPMQRRPGAQDRVDLFFVWPSLDPPDVNAEATIQSAAATPPEPLERIFVTIAAAETSISPADRVLTIYPHFTAGEASLGPGGLTVLPFRQGTPYQGEDRVYDGNAPGFLVRCTRQVGSTPGTCLYERWIETAKVVLRFPRDWLADWRTVAANSERLIENLRTSHR
jgi:hypothetical protein